MSMVVIMHTETMYKSRILRFPKLTDGPIRLLRNKNKKEQKH